MDLTAESRRVLSDAIAHGPDSGANAIWNEGRRDQMERVQEALCEFPRSVDGKVVIADEDLEAELVKLWRDIPGGSQDH